MLQSVSLSGEHVFFASFAPRSEKVGKWYMYLLFCFCFFRFVLSSSESMACSELIVYIAPDKAAYCVFTQLLGPKKRN